MPAERPTALVTAPMRGPGLELLRDLAEVVVEPWISETHLRILDADQLAARAAELGATILVVEADLCAGPVFDLPLVAVASTRGAPDNVDLPAATAAGVPVLHAPGRNADGVAELTVGLLLAAGRRIVAADRDVRQGEIYRDGTIPYQRFRAWQVAGRTAGLVGFGATARATKWRLEGLGMRVITHDPYVGEASHSLDRLLAESDVVSMHAVVTAETARMMGAPQFAALRPGAVYLNSARAQLHDTEALVEALRRGQLGAAGLDHFADEYLAPDHPLTTFDNVVLTPHIGGATFDTEVNHSLQVAEDLCRLLAGATPRHIANPEVLSAGVRRARRRPSPGAL